MLAVKGTIQGNTVVIEEENIQKYEGKDVPIRRTEIYKGDER